ncbi:MAG: thiamine biosynthesis protein ThiS [Bacillota bacterium]|nr:thiamine biosynthesis protein ThiS [Bacillota bacterium]
MIFIIKVNNRELEWYEGMTIEDIFKIKNYTWTKIIVKVNKQVIDEENYKITIVNDGDDVQMLHLLAGG